ncbi:MAG: hypothetical protein M1828_005590 [Chrysothrix sp. TS-e1954]|nr:MAG: hypothetical protein M1828_005590 [Chrysothrix sp. TS-e1954]
MELSFLLLLLCTAHTSFTLPIPSQFHPMEHNPRPEHKEHHRPPAFPQLKYTSWVPWKPADPHQGLVAFPAQSKPHSKTASDDTSPSPSPGKGWTPLARSLVSSAKSLRLSLLRTTRPSFWKRRQYFVPSSSSISPQDDQHRQTRHRWRATSDSPLTLLLWLFLASNAMAFAWRLRQSRLKEQARERYEMEKGWCGEGGCALKVVVSDFDALDERDMGLSEKG